MTLTSDEPGTLTIRWDAASPAPGDYRVNWARADEAFPSWQDDEGNAYPTSNSYTLSDLDEGSEYKVQVRSRYFDENGDLEDSGPWSEEGRLTVAVQQDVVLRNSEDVTEETLKNRRVGPRQSDSGPTVTIAGAEGETVVEEVNQVDGAAFDIPITFSAAVGDTFEHTDITLTNAQTLTTTDIITSTSGLTYTATIRPTAGFTGTVTVQVPAGAAQNASNEDNQTSNVFSATVTTQSAYVTGGAVPAGDEYAALAGECATLLGLHDTLVGSATLDPAWSVHTDIESWQGVSLAGYRVSRISLVSQNLDGSLLPELGDLTQMMTLTLHNNQLTGAIPPELGNLSKLKDLDLSYNQLTGEIPSELGSLGELTELRLLSNQLTGAIPSELGDLTQLRGLFLGTNQVSGSIPGTLGDLSALESLGLNYNQFDAELPSELAQLTSLQLLELNDAQLKGPILDLSVMTSLEFVDLQENQLTGTISSLSSLTGLKRFNLIGLSLGGHDPVNLRHDYKTEVCRIPCQHADQLHLYQSG